jgi:type VI secretion system secreted protein Hcp
MGSVEATSRRAWTALTVTKQIDRSTTGLMSSLAQNAVIKEAKLTMRRSGSGQQDYLTITLNDARITRVEHSVAADGSTVETVAFAFTQVNVEYRQQQLGGLVGGGYSFVDQMLPN